MTTETNAERLGRIKNKVVKEGPHSLDYWGFVHEDMKFIVEQAERVQVLEESIKAYALAVEIYSEMPLKEAMEKLTKWAEEEFG